MVEAKTEEILVVGCFTSFMCKWIRVMIAVDQAWYGDDVGLHQGFGRVDRPCPGDDEVLNIKGSDVWTALALVTTWVCSLFTMVNERGGRGGGIWQLVVVMFFGVGPDSTTRNQRPRKLDRVVLNRWIILARVDSEACSQGSMSTTQQQHQTHRRTLHTHIHRKQY